ncbi:MAG: gamma-glutamyltransferase family protein [Candidatus Solibacter usitatus]|nr:gamma-glutamyltransferase family protein [Candidatus Solibacter usitatus]
MERSEARSMVISRQGIVATSQTLASQAGAQVLARGGSAIDAAIAANAVLGVVEPMSNGIGGDLFALYWEAETGQLTGLNASGWAPAGLDIAFLQAKGIVTTPPDGIHSVTVPGCVDGWEKLHQRFGGMAWAELFRPAIYYAENGFPVTEIIADTWQKSICGSSAPATGDIFRNPALGRALELIARDGPEAMYRGPIGESIVATSKRLGGAMAPADLSEYSSEWVEPISTEYRGWTIYEIPPSSQGIAALEMLNLMERFPLGDAADADALHVKIEAQKLAYADLQRYVADPRYAKVPVGGLLSKKYAAERAALIDSKRALSGPRPGSPLAGAGDTIYLAVVDSAGNIASLIQSIYHSFGSGVYVDDWGFHLHNRGALFEMDATHPNALAGRKRPFHTIIPAFMERGSTHIGFGIMGGLNQAQAHAQFVANIVDHGMNIQGALEAPRFTKLNFGGCDVLMESRVPAETRAALEARGHEIEVMGAFSGSMGGGQAVLHDSESGVNYGASSPRKDGAAVPEAPDFWG